MKSYKNILYNISMPLWKTSETIFEFLVSPFGNDSNEWGIVIKKRSGISRTRWMKTTTISTRTFSTQKIPRRFTTVICSLHWWKWHWSQWYQTSQLVSHWSSLSIKSVWIQISSHNTPSVNTMKYCIGSYEIWMKHKYRHIQYVGWGMPLFWTHTRWCCDSR